MPHQGPPKGLVVVGLVGAGVVAVKVRRHLNIKLLLHSYPLISFSLI